MRLKFPIILRVYVIPEPSFWNDVIFNEAVAPILKLNASQHSQVLVKGQMASNSIYIKSGHTYADKKCQI